MITAHESISSAMAFLYLDTDALITVNRSFVDLLSDMRKHLRWNLEQQPVAFNQDGPGWACDYTMRNAYYPYCLNSGTVFWLRNEVSLTILKSWWNSAGDPYGQSKFPRKWRTKWPWEQAQQYKIYEAFNQSIMRLSFPNEPFLPWKSRSSKRFKRDPRLGYMINPVKPWCFSHFLGADCFITHFCASKAQKLYMMKNYIVHDYLSIPVSYIKF
jgi:hypothetical protein